ncbi:MAG: hypothetical protein Q8O67_34385 [Deltaproteobacteria bacterium]|nr:hypothetical protein [Deltaproteobacteria bacterium]
MVIVLRKRGGFLVDHLGAIADVRACEARRLRTAGQGVGHRPT